MGDYVPNRNQIPLGYENHELNVRQNLDPNSIYNQQVGPHLEPGPLNMILERENSPLNFVERKKWQWVLGDNEPLLDTAIEHGSFEISASFAR